MRIKLNKWDWQYGGRLWSKNIEKRIRNNIEINVLESIISINSEICPVPMRCIYNYIQNILYKPEMMRCAIPMSVTTPTTYHLINDWRLDRDNYESGMYFSPDGDVGSTWWRKATQGGRFPAQKITNEAPMIFLGDYILHKETDIMSYMIDPVITGTGINGGDFTIHAQNVSSGGDLILKPGSGSTRTINFFDY